MDYKVHIFKNHYSNSSNSLNRDEEDKHTAN